MNSNDDQRIDLTSDSSPIEPPFKKKKLHEHEKVEEQKIEHRSIVGCRDVSAFEFIAKLGDGTYGIVSKVRDKQTKEEFAMKGIKMEDAKEGFPLQALREIKTLMSCSHPNVVNLHEIVVGNAGANVYLVMEYVENDLYTLMEARDSPFTIAETKCLMKQLLAGVAHLHSNWVLHRDLKPANLLLSNQGILKLADFGLAREYGSPLHPMTAGVVTLRYRAPEVLLGGEYTPAIDIWSCGCIFAELLTKKSLFAGHNEIEQLDKIFKILGTPSEKIWPGYSNLPAVKNFAFISQPYSTLKKQLPQLSESGFSLLKSMFIFDPNRRITALEALNHPYFDESPLPMDPSFLPTHRPKVDV